MTTPGSRMLVLLCVALLMGCSGPADHVEVPTPSGRTLDCPGEEVAYFVSQPDLVGAIGASSGRGAMESLHDLDRPAGEPIVEETSSTETMFLFLDDAGNRLGRVGTRFYPDQGWFVVLMEKCGGVG